MLNYIFPFLHVRQIFGSEFSLMSFLVFNSHAILALYILFILLFRKVLIYSYRFLFFNILVGLVVYIYLNIHRYSSWYEIGAIWMMFFGVGWICAILSFLVLLSDLLFVSERKVKFQFWRLEKYLTVMLSIDILYLFTAMLLYFLT